MRGRLLRSLETRIKSEISSQSSLKFFKDVVISDHVDQIITIVYLYTRVRRGHNKGLVYLSEIISALGHGLRNRMKMKKDSSAAAKLGGFILYSFEELELIQVVLGQGRHGHGAYIVSVLNEDALANLWNSVSAHKIEKLPSLKPYAPWESTIHASGMSMIRTGNKDVLQKISKETHPILFECLNRSQEVGWRINTEVYNIHAWALRNKTEAFSDIWEASNLEARATKLREAKAIGDIAKRFIGSVFYHLYYYDFRGRKYPETAYLHEQGSDLARGLLYRAVGKPIGKSGFFWLTIAIANNWGGDSHIDGIKTDKLPLEERFAWVIDNEDILLSYAETPKVNQGWMKADKPWQFLAACIELKNLRIWQMTNQNDDQYGFISGLEVYIDGSNNGCQHLAALSRDEITAPHVNLISSTVAGDLYKYVSGHVWSHISELYSNMPKDEVKACERYIDDLIEIKKQINAAELRSTSRSELIEKIKRFKEDNEAIAEKSAIVFWHRIVSQSQRRKIIKRNIMTLPYGGTPYGLGEQQINDAKKHGIELLQSMEHRWGAWLGRLVYEDCKVSLRRPMQLLRAFEIAGHIAELEGRFLSWTVPVTNFPVVQNYTEGVIKKVYVQYGPPKGARLSTGYFENTLQISICFIETVSPSKGKQSQGASPNAIHSLDAAHLALTVHNCNFPVTTIHDSFGCLLSDMQDLFRIVRESFVQLYESDPIKIIDQMGGDTTGIDFGSLDIHDITNSQYCFA